MSWTDERVELLKTLQSQGLSCSQIGARVGKTRNSVIGKLFRMGLSASGPKRKDAPRPRPAMRRARRDAQRRVDNPVQRLLGEPFVPQPEPFIPPSERKPILIRKADGLHANDELTPESCRWPCGEVTDADFGFCGKTKVPGLPYCTAHARLAFNATNPRPPAAARPAPPVTDAEIVEPASIKSKVAA